MERVKGYCRSLTYTEATKNVGSFSLCLHAGESGLVPDEVAHH
jgi:hypothetical protein